MHYSLVGTYRHSPAVNAARSADVTFTSLTEFNDGEQISEDEKRVLPRAGELSAVREPSGGGRARSRGEGRAPVRADLALSQSD